ncbi:MAG: fibronectin type III-like domain-contianing protein [Actinomycetota bacterium]|nr:fibronectin type III-like domain-contianing protein [Actinomycetota bacterium]
MEIAVARRRLAHWSADAGDFAVEPGSFTLAAGRSSRDLRVDGEVTVTR